MFNRKPAENTLADEAIENAYNELKGYDADSEEYAQIIEQIVKMHEMQVKQTPDRISKDTLLMVLGNLAGIVVIVGHERAHIVTSKAMSLIRSAR